MDPSDSKGYYLELPQLLLPVAILSDIISKYLLVIDCHWGKKHASLLAFQVTNALLFIRRRPSSLNCSFCVYCWSRQADKWQAAPTSRSNSEYIKERNLCTQNGMSLFSRCPHLFLPNIPLMVYTEGRVAWTFLTMKSLIVPKRKETLLYLLKNEGFWSGKITCISITVSRVQYKMIKRFYLML